MHFWLHHTVQYACRKDSLVHGFCVSRKGGTEGGGWDHLQGAVHVAALPLAVEGLWLVPGRSTLALAAGLENATLTLKGVYLIAWEMGGQTWTFVEQGHLHNVYPW